MNTIIIILFLKKLIDEIIKYMENVICEEVKPQKSVFIAIDGSVPNQKYINKEVVDTKVSC